MRAFLILSILLIAGFYGAIEVQNWERENGYPFGRLCELTRQCRS